MLFVYYFTWVLFGSFGLVNTLEKLGLEGCSWEWTQFNDFCYMATYAHLPFDAAKAECEEQGAMLTSLWGPEEVAFVNHLLSNLDVIKPSSWIGTSVLRSSWVWLDGSGPLDNAVKGEADTHYCGILTPERDIEFVRCELTMSAFVCKKALDRVYVPSTTNITPYEVLLTKDPDETIFERLWPPLLDKISTSFSPSDQIGTLDVPHETDCAYRCYTIDECQAFVVVCKSTRRCSEYVCKLLSGLTLL